MTRTDALARLAVCAAEARAALLACGLDDVSDASVAGAIADADAELEASVAPADGRLVHVLRRRRKALIALHEYLAPSLRVRDEMAAEERALRALDGETT